MLHCLLYYIVHLMLGFFFKEYWKINKHSYTNISLKYDFTNIQEERGIGAINILAFNMNMLNWSSATNLGMVR